MYFFKDNDTYAFNNYVIFLNGNVFFLYTSSPPGFLRNKTLEHQENVTRKLLFEML